MFRASHGTRSRRLRTFRMVKKSIDCTNSVAIAIIGSRITCRRHVLASLDCCGDSWLVTTWWWLDRERVWSPSWTRRPIFHSILLRQERGSQRRDVQTVEASRRYYFPSWNNLEKVKVHLTSCRRPSLVGDCDSSRCYLHEAFCRTEIQLNAETIRVSLQNQQQPALPRRVRSCDY